jgi:putative tricarboxylic transport membrane protein
MVEDVRPSHEGPEPIATNGFRGGVAVAVVALIFVLSTFQISSPLVPRALAIIVALVGILVAAGVIRVRAPQDFYGGIVLVLLAVFAMIASAELPGQRGFAFGPGTAPRLFSVVLVGLGTAVTLTGVFRDGPPIEKYRIRGPLLVVIAIALYAMLIRPFGLVVATYLTFMVAILGSTEMRWIESLIAAAAMTVFCYVLFVVLLGLPFQLWPQPNAPALLYTQVADVVSELWMVFQKLAFIR